MTLRLLSYLSPSVPEALFATLADHLAATLGDEVELRFDPSQSGPRPGEPEPFTSGEADVAFVCATSYVWLTSGPQPAVELVGAAWVPSDDRSTGEPVYFGEVLAGVFGPESLEELVGRRVAYNDDVSLSGYHSLRLALARKGINVDQVELVRSGSHLRSIDLVTSGGVDAAAVDSTVWRRRAREEPGLAERVQHIGALGPYPVQPPVARRGLPARSAIREALLEAHLVDDVAAALARADLSRFVAVVDEDYAGLRKQLSAPDLGEAMPPR